MKCVAVALLAACAHPSPPRPASQHRRGGELMIEVGMRYARVSREIAAERWELAAYDVHELRETFEDDLLPHTWNENPAMQRAAKQFLDGPLAQLEATARTKDHATWSADFAATTKACNACHLEGKVAFIEIDATGALRVSDPVR